MSYVCDKIFLLLKTSITAIAGIKMPLSSSRMQSSNGERHLGWISVRFHKIFTSSSLYKKTVYQMYLLGVSCLKYKTLARVWSADRTPPMKLDGPSWQFQTLNIEFLGWNRGAQCPDGKDAQLFLKLKIESNKTEGLNVRMKKTLKFYWKLKKTLNFYWKI